MLTAPNFTNSTALKMGIPVAFVAGTCAKDPSCSFSRESAAMLQMASGIAVEHFFRPVSFDRMVDLLFSGKVDITTPLLRATPQRLFDGVSFIPVIASEVFGRFVFRDDLINLSKDFHFSRVFSPITWSLLLTCGALVFVPTWAPGKVVLSYILALLYFLYQTFVLYSLVQKHELPFQTYEGAIHCMHNGFVPILLAGSRTAAEFLNRTQFPIERAVQIKAYTKVPRILDENSFYFGINHFALQIAKHSSNIVMSNHKASLIPPWLMSLILPTHPLKARITRAYNRIIQHGLFEAQRIRIFHNADRRWLFKSESGVVSIALGKFADFFPILLFPIPALVVFGLERLFFQARQTSQALNQGTW